MARQDFLDLTPKAGQKESVGDKTSPKVNTLVFQKILQESEKDRKYLQSIYLIWELYSEYAKNSYNGTTKRKKITQPKKWVNIEIGISPKKAYELPTGT